MKKYIIILCILLVLIFICFIGYFVYSKNDNQTSIDTLKSKVNDEISYLNTTIIGMLNQFNNISFTNYQVVEKEVPTPDSSETSSGQQESGGEQGGSQQSQQGGSTGSNSNTVTAMEIVPNSILTNKNNAINWDMQKQTIEQIYETWTTILLDLSALNVNNDNLLKFHTTLDKTTTALEAQDKRLAISSLAELYGLLPLYLNEYSDDRTLIAIYATKSNVLFAYALMEYDDKSKEIKTYLDKAKNEFSYVVNNPIANNDKISNINKSYVELNEIEKDNSIKQKKIFYVHYKNLMQELEML